MRLFENLNPRYDRRSNSLEEMVDLSRILLLLILSEFIYIPTQK